MLPGGITFAASSKLLAVRLARVSAAFEEGAAAFAIDSVPAETDSLAF